VVRLPRISNFTDVDALGLEPDLEVSFAASPRDLVGVDLVVLPGTRATVDDLAWLRSRGLDTAIASHADSGRAVLGICGGAQMLGAAIDDPDGVEGSIGASATGLGLLDATTRFSAEKVLRLSTGTGLGHPVTGYEIHHGTFEAGTGQPFPGGVRNGAVFATMWHGTLESDGFRTALLAEAAAAAGVSRVASDLVFARCREARLDLLGDLVTEHLDLDRLLELALSGAPSGLPVLAPGGAVGQ
jgi:adenosylcobyric acid synthase